MRSTKAGNTPSLVVSIPSALSSAMIAKSSPSIGGPKNEAPGVRKCAYCPPPSLAWDQRKRSSAENRLPTSLKFNLVEKKAVFLVVHTCVPVLPSKSTFGRNPVRAIVRGIKDISCSLQHATDLKMRFQCAHVKVSRHSVDIYLQTVVILASLQSWHHC